VKVVYVFLFRTINYSNINEGTFRIHQGIEIRAIKLQSEGQNICIVAIYRVPSGNFSQSLNSLDRALNTIYRSGIVLIACDDININYLMDSQKKKQLNTLCLLIFSP
jgi:hypothetical protein